MPKLHESTVVVTGATGGLGPAVCERFLDEGATVAAVSRSGRAPLKDDRLRPIAADLSTTEGVRAMLEAIGAPVDVLVHVLGGFAGGSPIAETDDETLAKMLELNVWPAFHVLRAVLPGMVEGGSGAVVAVGAAAALDPPQGLGAYAASKAALNALVSTAAKETIEAGVTVNAVLPTTIDTAANRKAMPGVDRGTWIDPGRLADDIVWLAGEEASGVTGGLFEIHSEAKPLRAR